MLKYIMGRLLLLIPILLGVVFIVFFIMALTPGSPARMILGEGASPEAIRQLNHDLGFDKPFLVRFANYMYKVVFELDFGTSYRTQKPVFEDIFSRLPYSIIVAFNGILCASVIGIPLGILSAVKHYTAIDVVASVAAMLIAAIPFFWLGMMLIWVFALKLGLLHTSGVASWQDFILPMFTVGIPYAASQMRMTRSAMLETIKQDYIRTARAKGASEAVIVFRHALKNALLPIITVIASNFGILLGGAIITETVFAIPGLGTLILTGIRTKDIPIVLAGTIVLAALFCIIMLIVDLIYAFIDPRIKAKYSR